VANLNAAGSALIYATFLGGSSWDDSCGIAMDSSGNAYITGGTESSDFPTTPGAFDTTFNWGTSDAFMAKLNTAGSALIYATFLGGSSTDCGYGIAVDGGGNAYVTGYTFSSDFPTTPGAFDTTFNGGEHDAFVAKLNAAGSGLAYAIFLGGSSYGGDFGHDIAVEASGAAYVTGYTFSSDFPTTPGAFDTIHNGGRDAFVVKLNAAGSALIYATFLGGSDWDEGYGIAVDWAGSAYMTGYTESSDFPTTPGAFDRTHNGGDDAFVVKLNPAGSSYATFLGGSSSDGGYGIAIDASGAAYVTGSTNSYNFPTTPGAFDTTHNGSGDAFVTKLAFLPNLSCSTKQTNTVQVVPGQLVTYTINLFNCEGGDAPQVWMTDTLPISLTYQAGSLWASTGTYGEAGGVITWTGPVAAGTSAVVRLSAVVSPELSPTETVALINVAWVDDGRQAPFGRTAVVFINPYQSYLPLILCNR
jgi:uncharacterized repeat protein (TIGR01451 family)